MKAIIRHIKKFSPSILLLLFGLLYTVKADAQFSCSMSGALNSPTALLLKDGTFSFGGNYLPSEMMPSAFKYNSGNYFVNIAFFPFMELSYRSTLIRCESTHPLKTGYTWNKDRSIAVKFRVVPEGNTWRPAFAIGSNDIVTTNSVTEPTSDAKGNRYFASIYGVITKNILINRQKLELSTGYYMPFYNRSYYKGIFGSVAWRPKRAEWLSLWGEYDCNAINMGIRTFLAKHLELQMFCYDFKAVSGGIRYSLNILARR